MDEQKLWAYKQFLQTVYQYESGNFFRHNRQRSPYNLDAFGDYDFDEYNANQKWQADVCD